MKTQISTPTLAARLNSRERKAQRLLAHYHKCEVLAEYLNRCSDCKGTGEQETGIGMLPCDACHGTGKRVDRYPDGKKISVALFKAERLGSYRATEMCSNSHYGADDSERDKLTVERMVEQALGTLPPGFFVNSDPRGYSLKIDNENPEGAKLIEACGLQRDLGGFGCLSPEINGDR